MKRRKIPTLPPGDPESPSQSPPQLPLQSPLYVRLSWMAAIWAGSVIALLVVAGLVRLVIKQ